MNDVSFAPVTVVRPLQPHGAEAEASGHLSHHSENPQSDSRKDHRQLQQEATATIQVCVSELCLGGGPYFPPLY